MSDSVRSRMATAAKRIARLKRIDRAAVFIITLGGVSVIFGVLGILLFIGAQTLPLMRSADVRPKPAVGVAEPAASQGAQFRAAGVDEYRTYLYGVDADARIAFYRVKGGGSPASAVPIPGLKAPVTVVSTSSTVMGGYVAAGTSDGRVGLAQILFTPKYNGDKLADVDINVRDRGVALLAPGKPIRQVSYLEEDALKHVAAIVGDNEVALWRTDDSGAEHASIVSVTAGEKLSHVRVGRRGAVIAASTSGHLYHWVDDQESPRLTDVSSVGNEPITALDFVIGGTTAIVGTESGQVTAWFRAALADGREVMLNAHTYAPQGSRVIAFAASPRERSFAALGQDGAIVLRHATSERTLARTAGFTDALHVLVSPKADAIFAVGAGRFVEADLKNPHPEVSWRALFGKTWYEGYAQPEYVWQSTGGTDDVEPKLSLVPLVFGTLKGTFYAMLFAIPIAVLAALYASQFVHPSIKAKVKPTVEIMAALPSVVIGFLAGLYLAPVVEKNLVGVFLMFMLMPVLGASGVFFWRMLPKRLLHRLRPGTEIFFILPLVFAGAWLAIALGPGVESWVFGGDARFWLQEHLGLTYDQRNCLVVGIAMGFAVIPIIFTISEDAFTSVPSNLTAASLALGASRWQTAVRVVLPTASPGVFSAVMVGLGRAVGETMIVLMATGNTPVLDWSIFNGIRTLAANIAVEIPEAPQGGTLYRTLFLSAALLFVITFTINTIAEVIRQRLRERYKAI